MRANEPFFLEPPELNQHAQWLWGGGLPSTPPSHRELTVDVLLEWFAEPMPST